MDDLNKRKFGSKGEELAITFLQENGYEILEKNYRVGRMGEIDIIARESEYICFIEVKTRTSYLYGLPSEAVDRRKQGRIRRVAQVYINQKHLHNSNIRFDIVEIMKEKSKTSINVIKNAF